MTPEFSRRYALDTIGSDSRDVRIEGNPAERSALAVRFGLLSIASLTATAALRASAQGVEATGRLSAQLMQACVVTGHPVPADVDEAFALRFVAPQPVEGEAGEVELSDSDCDVVEMDGGAVDLGEAVAQTLGLALDPFPRAPGAGDEGQSWAAGPEAGPFAGLKGMLER